MHFVASCRCIRHLCPEFDVTGKVVDNEGLEVIGGNVTVKGKQNTGTRTDINGKYTITVSDPQKDVLVFSFIGLENMEVPVKGRKQIDVTMKAASVCWMRW